MVAAATNAADTLWRHQSCGPLVGCSPQSGGQELLRETSICADVYQLASCSWRPSALWLSAGGHEGPVVRVSIRGRRKHGGQRSLQQNRSGKQMRACCICILLTNLDEWLHAFTVPAKQRLFEEGKHFTYSKCFSYYLYLLNFLIIITKKNIQCILKKTYNWIGIICILPIFFYYYYNNTCNTVADSLLLFRDAF